MSAQHFRVLPEGTRISDILDDPDFTDVTGYGEIYTLFTVVRITHESVEPGERWTHLANIARVRVPAIGTALLRVVGRSIEDSEVSLSPAQD